MSMIFYPAEFEVAVDDPGYGYVYCRGYGWDWRRVGGADLGRFLAAVTELALGGPMSGAVRTTLPPELNCHTASEVLPGLQRAVLLAAAGTDRFAILIGDDEAPERLCVHCDEGSYYTRWVCDDDHQHHQFGARWDGQLWPAERPLEVS